MESSSSGQPPPLLRRRDRLRAAVSLSSSRRCPLSNFFFRGRASSVSSQQPAIPSPTAMPEGPVGVIESLSDPRLRQPGNRTGMHISPSPLLHSPPPTGLCQPEGTAPLAPIHSTVHPHPQHTVLTPREPSNPQPGYGDFRAAALRSGVDARLLQRGNRSGIHDFIIPLLKTHCLSDLYLPASPAHTTALPPAPQLNANSRATPLSTPLTAHPHLQPPTPRTILTNSDARRERQSRRATWAPTIFEGKPVPVCILPAYCRSFFPWNLHCASSRFDLDTL
jgi:hypothetical protein